MDKKRIGSSFFWRFLERICAQGVTLIVSIVLARLLEPELYGIIALIMVFTSILQVFVDGGFSVALIQKKEVDDLDFSSVFWFNVFMCSILYVILFLTAPLISSFYEMEITLEIRILGLLLIVSGLKSVQIAYVSKSLEFKKFFFATLIGTIIAAVVGILLAIYGYGIWALILQNLLNQAIDTIVLWIVVKWKPQLKFSFTRIKKLFSFGWKMLLSSVLDKVYNELRALIIGKKYTSDDLAYYKKADQFPDLIATNINSSIDSVLLPVMSAEQDNKERVKAITRRAIKTSSFILWPFMIGLAVCSTSIVSLLLTDKWLPAVPYMVIFCVTYGFYPIHTANLNAIKAMGRSDLFLVLEIIKKCVGISIVLVTMWFGVIWIALGGILSSIISQVINSWPNRKLLGYSYLEQLKDICPSLLLACVMGGLVYCVNLFNLSNWITLLIQIPLGMAIYIGSAKILKMESYIYLVDTAKSFLHKKEK